MRCKHFFLGAWGLSGYEILRIATVAKICVQMVPIYQNWEECHTQSGLIFSKGTERLSSWREAISHAPLLQFLEIHFQSH